LADLTGNWADIELKGAEVVDGSLDLGPGKIAVAKDYDGPEIAEKTLVAWVRMQSFDARSGGPLAIASIDKDQFDAICFAERQAKRWMSGSTGWWRTEDVMEFDEDLLDPDVIQLAITYADRDGDGTLDVSIYRNGELLGSYSKGSLPKWAAGENFAAVFGPRTYQNENPGGAIDALVDEARIYNAILTQAQINALSPEPYIPPPPPAAEDFLVGQWTFNEGDELTDLTGNWGEIELNGAEVFDGHLDLSPGKFAVAVDYTGPTIGEKTLVAWVRMESFDVRSGGPLAISHPTKDQFDAICWAERQADRWMAGSTGWWRTMDVMEFDEDLMDPDVIQLAITYADSDGDGTLDVSIYRNGELLGSYSKGSLPEWVAGEAQAIFGPRTYTNQNPGGAIDALVDEARIYNTALTQDQINELWAVPPAPDEYLVGHWTFERAEELIDKTGHWADIQLQGAEVVDGHLDLSPGNFAFAGDYQGPTIGEKTLVAWVRLQSFDARAGGPLAISSVDKDQFDAICWAERQAKRWMAGSTGFWRTQDVMEFDETALDPELVKMAITYATGEEYGLKVTLYRNGELLGSYEKGSLPEWHEGEKFVAVFGPRTYQNENPGGTIDALVEEARIYDTVLTQAQIKSLTHYVPDQSDTDGDGLPDPWEIEQFGNLAQTADGDPDGDGLDNLGELVAVTDPNKADTDGDGLNDAKEVAQETDPLKPDSDGDELKDNVETGTGIFVSETDTGTDPNKTDTDGDGLDDGVEVAAGSDPNDAMNTPGGEKLLVGHWTFNSGEGLTDSTGNWADIELKGAEVVDGQLDLSPGKYAVAKDYDGPEIAEKTLVAWVRMQSFDARSGGPLAIASIDKDQFDAICFAERQAKRWMSGSTGWWRTEDVMEFDENLLDPDVIQLAITYADSDGDGTLDVSVYRNGELLGSYSKGSLPKWAAGENFAAVFGPRAYQNENPGGAIDALVDEARIYGAALSGKQIKTIYNRGPIPKVDVEPRHQWTFNVSMNDVIGPADMAEVHGNAKIEGGRLVLGGGQDQVITKPIGEDLSVMTLMAWVSLNDVNPGGGWGAIAVQARAVDKFDAIAYGERTARQWMAGSTGFRRTVLNNGGPKETLTEPDEIMMAIAYDDDGTITIYRNGEIYADAESASKGHLITYNENDFVGFGRRVFGTPPNMNGFINEARIYDTALSADQIRAIFYEGPEVGGDSDGDGLEDSWEMNIFGNLDQKPEDDPDKDGLDNLSELLIGTDPNEADSDGDGLKDGAETKTGKFVDSNDTGTDPLNVDSDGDTLEDGVETGTGIFVSMNDTGTNPNSVDSDGDLISDIDELDLETDPNDPNDPGRPDPSDSLVGRWTFEPGEEWVDRTGNWGEIELKGATFVDGQLDLGPGKFALAADYTGPEIREKTLVAWVRMQSLNVRAGGPLGISHPARDQFDAICFAERQAKRWMPGSTGFWRTQDIMKFDETVLSPELLQIAISYSDNDEDGLVEVTLFRNGELIGSYEKGSIAEWVEGEALAVFGPRAYDIRNGNASGAIDCLVEEARIYNMAMGQADIRQLSLVDAAPFEIVITDATVDGDGFFEFTWNSRPGDLYQVERRESMNSAWQVIAEGYPEGGATADQVSYTDKQLGEMAFYRVAEYQPPPIFEEDFESGLNGWKTTDIGESGTLWELGKPTNGPSEAHSGANVFGTGLSADYADDTIVSLFSPLIDLTGIDKAKLEFWSYLDIEGPINDELTDYADVYILDENGEYLTDEPLWTRSGSNEKWRKESISIPDQALGKKIQFEFHFGADYTSLGGPYAGWFIDDVSISQ
jgi:hypothetical protein